MCGNGDRVWLKGAEKHLEGLSRAEAGSQSRGTLNLTFLCDFFCSVLWPPKPLTNRAAQPLPSVAGWAQAKLHL